MDLALNNLQRLICHKTQQTNQPTHGWKLQLRIYCNLEYIVYQANIFPKEGNFNLKKSSSTSSLSGWCNLCLEEKSAFWNKKIIKYLNYDNIYDIHTLALLNNWINSGYNVYS